MPLDKEVFKEPRGFIRCLTLLFGIVAFSTLANFSTEFSFNIKCKNETEFTLDDIEGLNIYNVAVFYPFNIAGQEPINLTRTNGGPCGVNFVEQQLMEYGEIKFMKNFNYSSDAQFFVFVGVISFLISLIR